MLRSWCKLQFIVTGLRLWRWPPHLEQRPHSLHAPHSQLWQSCHNRFAQETTGIQRTWNMQTTHSRDFKSTQCRIVPSIVLASSDSQSRVSADSLEQAHTTLLTNRIPLSSSFFIQVDLLASYYKNISDPKTTETKEPNSDVPEPDTCGNWGTARWNMLLPVRSEHIYTSRLVQSMCRLFYKRTLTIRWLHGSELFDLFDPFISIVLLSQ